MQDVQVPVCPLCNQPVPINRGDDPNIKVFIKSKYNSTYEYCITTARWTSTYKTIVRVRLQRRFAAVVLHSNTMTYVCSCILTDVPSEVARRKR